MPQPQIDSIDPRIGLMVRVASELEPIFQTEAVDRPIAHKMAMSAISAYKPDGRADFINIARTIAFSMAAISLLGETTANPPSTPEKLRLYARATALSRCADQSERTMLLRRAYQRENPQPDLPDWMDPKTASSTQKLTDADVYASVANTVRQAREHTATPKPRPTPAAPAKPQSAPAAAANPPPPVIPESPVASAIHYNPPAAPNRPASYKATLLRDSAMPAQPTQAAQAIQAALRAAQQSMQGASAA